MALLPTTAGTPQNGSSSRAPQSVTNRLPVIFRRLFKFQQMVHHGLIHFFRLSDIWLGFRSCCLATNLPMHRTKESVRLLSSILCPVLTHYEDIGMCISISVRTMFLFAAFYKAHKNEETKNTWARDDPAILILIAGGMFGEIFAFPTVTFQDLTRL